MVKVKNGFTRIANELLEAMALTDLTGHQFRVLLTVIRLTYGYHKKLAPISNKNFRSMTGLTKSRVSQVVNQLVNSNIIIVENDSPGKVREYSLNKNYKDWKGYQFSEPYQFSDTYQKNETKGITKVKRGYQFSETFHKEPKDNIKRKEIYIAHFDTFWQSYPKKVSKKAAEKIFLKLKPDQKLLNQMLKAIENQKQSEQWQNKKYIPYPATWLNQERWQDELEKTKQEPKGFMV